MYYQILLIWRMHRMRYIACQKDGNLLKVTILKMSNRLGLLSFLWWHLNPLLAFVKPIYLLVFITEISNKGWKGVLSLESCIDKVLWAFCGKLKGRILCPLRFTTLQLWSFGLTTLKWVLVWRMLEGGVLLINLGSRMQPPSSKVSGMFFYCVFWYLYVRIDASNYIASFLKFYWTNFLPLQGFLHCTSTLNVPLPWISYHY